MTIEYGHTAASTIKILQNIQTIDTAITSQLTDTDHSMPCSKLNKHFTEFKEIQPC